MRNRREIRRAQDAAEVEITAEAIRGYSRLRRAVGPRIRIHVSGDGGMICEDASWPAHPRLWRVGSDGTIGADQRYSFSRRAFVMDQLPTNDLGVC